MGQTLLPDGPNSGVQVGELYRPSDRAYYGLDPLEYPFHDCTVAVTMCGRVCFGSRKINLSTVFDGQNVGVKEVEEKVWLISFSTTTSGSSTTRARASNAPRIRSLLKCCPCHRYKTLPMCPERTRWNWSG